MITTKQKWITILVCLCLLLLCSGFSLFAENGSSDAKIESLQDMKGQALGGVIAKMPDASAKIFFENIFGVKFGEYRSFSTAENAVTALKNGTVQGIWASDITAEYLVGTDEELAILPDSVTQEERLQFAMAFRPTDSALRDQCNSIIAEMKADGRLDTLITAYLKDYTGEACVQEDMSVNSKDYRDYLTGDTFYIGITGSVPPIECVNADGEPYGFCVQFADWLGQALKRKVKLLVFDNETIFTELMAGKLDAVFCYGTSANHSTEFPEYIMSEGYCPMYGYRMVVWEGKHV